MERAHLGSALGEAMPRVDAIWNHPTFQAELRVLDDLERDRIFCCHGLDHLLDVARIMWICALEEGSDLPRDVVYATALLHDIGRAVQYRTGEPHDQAGVRLASEILGSVDAPPAFSDAEREAILAAIGSHRGEGPAGDGGALAKLLYAADKASRPCYACAARAECNWPLERQNLTIRI